MALRATFLWSEHPSGASGISLLRYMINLMLKCVTPVFRDDSGETIGHIWAIWYFYP